MVVDNDLTPPGCGNICAAPNGFGGATEEFIFHSALITLTGTPPPTGWTFYWDYECCRNPVNNINTSGGPQMILRSVMYSVNGLSAYPCFDSSPGFAEKPTSFICIGYPYTYSPIGYDADIDSIAYSFDYPYASGGTGSGLGSPIIFTTPYSVNNPMPGNPVVDSITGDISLYPSPGTTNGNYALVLKATTYRCGEKNAEIFREIQVTLSASGCTGVLNSSGNNINHPPDLYPAPFQDPLTGLWTSYSDTVDAGDTVTFILNYTDFEQHISDSTFQNIWINASGAELDSGSVMPYDNCATPPCAYLSESTPAGPYTIAHTMNFNWITDCAHASFINNCVQNLSTYYFVFYAKDDACPAPAINYKTVTISVRKLTIYNNGDTLFTDSQYSNLQWFLNGLPITGATGNTYISAPNGIYTLQALTPGGCSLNSNPINRFTVGLEEVTSLMQLQIFPNPANSISRISAASYINSTLSLYDITGRILLQQPFNSEFQLNISPFSSGLYVIEVKDQEEKCLKGKIVRE